MEGPSTCCAGSSRTTVLPWVILALLLAAGWSTTGLVFRHIEEADALQIVFYRSLTLSVAVTSFIAFRYRINTLRAFRAIGWPGLIGGAGLGFASITFIMAIERTTIANISFLIATASFFVGALAWIAMREPMGRRTILASVIAMLGVVIMVGEGFDGGGWDGNLLALACAIFVSFYVVAVRFGRGRDMIPTVAVSGMMAGTAAVLASDGLSISLHDFALCLLQGVFISAVCNGLFTLWRPAPAGRRTDRAVDGRIGAGTALGLRVPGRGPESADRSRWCHHHGSHLVPGVLADTR